MAQRAFDALEERLTVWARRRPALALSGAARLGGLRNRLSRRWPNPEEVRALFPGLGAQGAARVAWRIGGLEARNRLLVETLRHSGLGPLRSLVETPAEALASLRPPLVLGFFHVGPVQALSALFERLPAPVMALRHGILHAVEPPLTLVTTEGNEQRRAAVFQRALAFLADGGFVALALDVVPGTGLTAPCLGRALPLARGPFALARLAGVPLVPFVARWRRGGIEPALGAPLAAPTIGPAGDNLAWEGALAAAAGRWLEGYLEAAPAELGLGLLHRLLGAASTAGEC
jgi:hypothetical protein